MKTKTKKDDQPCIAKRLINRNRDGFFGQVRILLDKRAGDAVTFALTIGAVRSA
jgi:hypothetical protein